MGSSLVGDWSTSIREFTIEEREGVLWLRCPQAPPGYDARLVDVAPDRVRIEGGPLHGAEIVIEDPEQPTLGGRHPMERLDRPAEAPPGWGLTAPEDQPSEDELERFQHLWNWLAHPSRAGEVEMGSCDLIRFLRWLSRNGLALFHGTDRIDLEQLTPDHLPPVSAGEVEAEEYVSASSDPLCSVFLSIVEREVATAPGTHRVERFRSLDGNEIDIYQFNLTAPTYFRPGGLDLLPRERFRQVTLYPGGPGSAEWVSLEPVRPLACMVTTPEDFPFLDQIQPGI